MSKKIAVAVVHGMGNQSIDFSNKYSKSLTKAFNKKLKQNGYEMIEDPIVVEPVYWAHIVQRLEEKLWHKIDDYHLGLTSLRRFVVSYLGDAIAYQATPNENNLEEVMYEDIHYEFCKTLRNLSNLAGDDAPLYVVAHSLGTVIASNLIYDLQSRNEFADCSEDKTPLELCDTLTSFYTLGSPLALWGLRYTNFGVPIKVPSPKLVNMNPNLNGEWINFYDKQDILAYPLKDLNAKYYEQVKSDIEVNSGNFLIRHTPLSHSYYWENKKVIHTIVESLFQTWLTINESN